MHNRPALDELFERRINYPDSAPQERLARLVGIDDQKLRLTKILGSWLTPPVWRLGSKNTMPVQTDCSKQFYAALRS